MNKTIISVIIGIILLAGLVGGVNWYLSDHKPLSDFKEPVDYVDPFIGTTAGLGNTFPGGCAPFGMVQLSPDTSTRHCSGYNYANHSMEGFSCTHLSGTGCGDYGNILFMPTTGEIKIVPGSEDNPDEGYRSRFDKEDEKASPGYYSIILKDYDIKSELTATKRAGFFKFTFPETNDAHILIDLYHRIGGEAINGYVKIVDSQTIEGYSYCNATGGGWCGDSNYTVYFVAKFSKPFDAYGTWKVNEPGNIPAGEVIRVSSNEESGKHIGAFVDYTTSKNEIVLLKVGISFVSIEGARKNLETEIPDWDFDKAKTEARESWNKELSKIEVEGGTEKQSVIFYTALYHTMIHPNIFSDVDGKYYGMDHKIHTTTDTHYAIFSGWDVFRAEMPLLTLIEPEVTNDIIQSLLCKYEQGGWLPIWEFANSYSNCMIGDPAVSVIVDAYVKGIRDFDVEEAYQAMRKSAMELPPPEHPFKGRRGLEEYKKLGYILEGTPGVWGSVSTTLEYAYFDWCIAQIVRDLGKEDDYELFLERASNYRNVFDPSTGFMRPRNKDGSQMAPFDPREKHGFCECNSWQQTWFVPHDVQGLINLMGRKEFIKKLDILFEQSIPHNFSSEFGKKNLYYFHGNEPDQHAVYLYDYAGVPWRTQEWVREIMEKAYGVGPDGLCGNDDCGQTSAWYVFSAMGFYPVCPGQNVYVIGSPIFDKITIKLDKPYSKGMFVIETINASEENKYIQSATLNNKSLNKPWLTHSDIVNGGILTFVMGPEPNRQWGSAPEDAPPSVSKGNH